MLGILIIVGVFFGIGFTLFTATAPEREQRKTFERLLESCGFRIMVRRPQIYGKFEGDCLRIGERTFSDSVDDMDGWKIAYRLGWKAGCCRQRCLYRLAQPYGQRSENAGLGPAVCARCGRIERDYDGHKDGIGGLLGSATNVFPVLERLARRDGEYADRAALKALQNECLRLEERREIIVHEISQLRARLPELPGNGPYRALPAHVDPADEG